jgi:hypothetical protein
VLSTPVNTNNNGDNNLGTDEVAVDAERATGVNALGKTTTAVPT